MERLLFDGVSGRFAFFLLSSEGAPLSESVGNGAISLFVRYAWYLTIILIGLFLLALMKRKSRKELTPETVRQNCIALKKRLESAISEETKSGKGKLGQAKMIKLRSTAEEAMWSALRLVNEGKELVFDGVAEKLDGVADILSDAAENMFAEGAETEKAIREALDSVNGIIVRLDEIIQSRKNQVK